MLRFHLKPFLERHHITAYQLARATKGKLSESTVYAMSRAPLQRIDLNSVRVVMTALEAMTGEQVAVQDLLEDIADKPSINPKYAHLLVNAKPADPRDLERIWTEWTPEELEADNAYWRDRDREKQSMRDLYTFRLQAELGE